MAERNKGATGSVVGDVLLSGGLGYTTPFTFTDSSWAQLASQAGYGAGEVINEATSRRARCPQL